MTNNEKMDALLQKLTLIYPKINVVKLQPKNVFKKLTPQELDFYYFWICCDGRER